MLLMAIGMHERDRSGNDESYSEEIGLHQGAKYSKELKKALGLSQCLEPIVFPFKGSYYSITTL